MMDDETPKISKFEPYAKRYENPQKPSQESQKVLGFEGLNEIKGFQINSLTN